MQTCPVTVLRIYCISWDISTLYLMNSSVSTSVDPPRVGDAALATSSPGKVRLHDFEGEGGLWWMMGTIETWPGGRDMEIKP